MKFWHCCFIFIAFSARFYDCSAAIDSAIEEDVKNARHLSLKESRLQALLTCFVNIPAIRNAVFANSGHLLDEHGNLVRPKCITDKIYLGLVCCIVRMAELSFKNDDEDRSIRPNQFFDFSLFPDFSTEALLKTLLASLPEPVKQIFSSHMSIPNHPYKPMKKLFLSLKPPEMATENILENIENTGQSFMSAPKILLISINRTVFVNENLGFNKLPLSKDYSLNILSNEYRLVAKVGHEIHPKLSAVWAVSHVKVRSTNDTVVTSLHANEENCYQYFSTAEFNTRECNSSLLVYESVADEVSFSQITEPLQRIYNEFRATYNLQDGINLPAIATQNYFDLKAMMSFVTSPNFNVQDCKFLIEMGILNHLSLNLVSNSALIFHDRARLTPILSLCTFRMKYDGGLSYSFRVESSSEKNVMHLQYVLAVLESSNKITAKIFEAAKFGSDPLIYELGIVLFQMLIGSRNISLRQLSSLISERLPVDIERNANYKNFTNFQNRIRVILQLLDPKLISIANTKVIKYVEINLDDVVSIETPCSHIPVPATYVIPPSYAEIDGAWIDLQRPKDWSRYRYIYSAPDSELFAVMIDRKINTIASWIFNPIRFCGRNIKIHSVIAYNPRIDGFTHIILEKDNSGIIKFKSGLCNESAPFSEIEYKYYVENSAIIVFFQNITSDTPVSSITFQQIPFSIFSQVYQDHDSSEFKSKKRNFEESTSLK